MYSIWGNSFQSFSIMRTTFNTKNASTLVYSTSSTFESQMMELRNALSLICKIKPQYYLPTTKKLSSKTWGTHADTRRRSGPLAVPLGTGGWAVTCQG